METPVAFIIFNRPDLVKKVFDEIARAKPSKLFVIADGPLSDHPDDFEKCIAARSVIENVDWECEVFRNYSDVNLGCGHRPATGISWVFEHVDRAIILEDDCVPHQTFFRFCEELLEKFLDDKRIGQICGNNFQFGRKRTPYSYFFSRHNICAGGWATWRRAWRFFDINVERWPALRNTTWLLDILGNQKAVAYWQDKFDRAYNATGSIDYWDYQWRFAFWAQNGLAITPNNTLVTNIGFREDATHTKSPNDITANLLTTEMVFPLKHPPKVTRNNQADELFIKRRFDSKREGFFNSLREKLSHHIPGPLKKAIRTARNRLANAPNQSINL